MPKFLRLGDSVIHVPSVSNISMGANCFGTAYLSILYHTATRPTHIYYGSWSGCEADFNKVKNAVTEVETLLSTLSLTEQPLTFTNEIKGIETGTGKVKESVKSFKETLDTLPRVEIPTNPTHVELKQLEQDNKELSDKVAEAIKELDTLSKEVTKEISNLTDQKTK